MSFSDTIFLFFLALILFGPKKMPEMARKAGKLLAELRRASNEFRSQIETEIAHLEVQNNQAQNYQVQNNQAQKDQTVPASPALQGTVSSQGVNPAASESIPPQSESSATLAAPTEEATASTSNASAAPMNSISNEAAGGDSLPASQESHA